MLDWPIRRDSWSGTMATGKRLKAAILARVAKGPRKRRTRPEPRQYTVADLERARDRVAAAERRIDNDRSRGVARAAGNAAGANRNHVCASIIKSGSDPSRIY